MNASLPAIWIIRLYQRWISPGLPQACRFWPTCSEYAAQAIEKKGFTIGSWLALRRLLKCHPFHPGGFDPVS
jgi:putative membrane protein insertion efficiency factor